MREDVHTKGIPALCASCEVRHRGVCGALHPDQLVVLARSSSRQTGRRGSQLIGESEAIDHYSNVLSGVVKLTKTLSDGRQQIVGLQFAPDFLGRPFLPESTVNAEAATTVELCSFPRPVLERLMAEQPSLERRLLAQTLRELDQAREWMVALGRKTACERVASFLLMICRSINPVSAGRLEAAFELPLTRTEIADFLGLALETISRQLGRLRKEGILSFESNRRVKIWDLERLAFLSGD